MRLACFLCLAFPVFPVVHGQPVKAVPPKLACESLCAELYAAIRANPGALVMRLEEALVINEGCAAELVTAAIDAVNADPLMVRRIVETANQLAPAKSAVIAVALTHYSAPVLSVLPYEEIRRAEAPAPERPRPLPGEEVRRAELPLATRNLPIVEVRRAELPGHDAVVKAEAPLDLVNVPKAVPIR